MFTNPCRRSMDSTPALRGKALEKREADEISHFFGSFPVAVAQFFDNPCSGCLVLDVRDPFIGTEPLRVFTDIGRRNADIEAHVDGGVDLERNFLAPEFLHRFFEKADIGVISDSFDMSVLLSAQQVARAPKFQIERGDLEIRRRDR